MLYSLVFRKNDIHARDECGHAGGTINHRNAR
jgi:hypothetical protein